MFNSLFDSSSGLSLQRLRTLCIVAESGSMSAAAKGDASKLAQYSKQITELQEFFGVQLKEENVKPVQLTECGIKLAHACRSLLQELDDLKVQGADDHITIRIGAGESLLQWVLPPFVDGLAKAFPKISVHLLNLRTKDINAKLLCGDIDLGVLSDAAADAALKTKKIKNVDGSSLLFVPKQLSKSLGKSPTFKDLTDLPLATLEGGGSFQHLIQAEAEKAGIQLNLRVKASSMPQIAAYINSGLYGGFLPKFAAQYLKDAVEVPLKSFSGRGPHLVFAASPKHLDNRTVVRNIFHQI